jgi:hypothetical protein
MRRQLEIFVAFTRATGHEHPNLRAAANNYAELLEVTGRSHEQILARLVEVAPGVPPPPLLVRAMALELFSRGDCAGAERLLSILLDDGFEPANTRLHIARLCLITDRIAEAREHVTAAWEARAEARAYVILRLLWFKVALAMLAASAASELGQDVSPPLAQLKWLLQHPDAFAEWTMAPVLDHLAPSMRSTEAGTRDWELLSALVAALNDREKLTALDAFPAWRDAVPQQPS